MIAPKTAPIPITSIATVWSRDSWPPSALESPPKSAGPQNPPREPKALSAATAIAASSRSSQSDGHDHIGPMAPHRPAFATTSKK